MATIACFVLMVVCGIVSARMTRTSPLGCTYYGTDYDDGDSFQTPDGRCQCFDGVIRCPPAEAQGCEYNGIPYFHREIFYTNGLKCLCDNGSSSCSRI
ncbi:hypothetical protein BsWGS_08708 [Bradybaena similaris]